MSEPSIVPLEERHLREVIEIERESFGVPWSMDGFLRALTNPGSLAYAAEIDGVVVGFVVALHVGEEGEILKLAVRSDVRGQGIARVLNARCLAELMELGCKHLYLEVRRSNLAAISLYEGFGFKRVGVRKSYYTSPVEDALLMKKEL